MSTTFRSSLLMVALLSFVGVASTAVAAKKDKSAAHDKGHVVKLNSDNYFVDNANAKRGEQLAEEIGCSGCHGPAGKGISSEYPRLAGQNAKYLHEELRAFKKWDDGEPAERKNSIMAAQVAQLNDQDMRDLAAYYALQEPKRGKEGSDELLALGMKLYKGGDVSREIPACIACHGAIGEGVPGSGYPRLAGQYAEYLIARLNAYQAEAKKIGELKIDESTNPMPIIALRLSEEEINALSYTLQGMWLRPEGQGMAETAGK